MCALSPLGVLLSSHRGFSRDDAQVDTLRTLLVDFDTIDDANPSRDDSSILVNPSPTYVFRNKIFRNIEAVEWLWIHAALVFHGIELICIRVKLTYILICHAFGDFHDFDLEVYHVLIRLLGGDMVEEYMKGTYYLLPTFLGGGNSLDSKLRGKAYLHLLGSLHLDAEACVARELQNRPGGLIFDREDYNQVRKIIFEKDEMQSLTLRWEWAYNPHALGYYVVSEFNALAGDTWDLWYESHWPFCEWRWWVHTDEERERLYLNKSRRFDRRTAAKARKERARTGQKRSQDKMPGTWEW
jgi:hypothetical protein